MFRMFNHPRTCTTQTLMFSTRNHHTNHTKVQQQQTLYCFRDAYMHLFIYLYTLTIIFLFRHLLYFVIKENKKKYQMNNNKNIIKINRHGTDMFLTKTKFQGHLWVFVGVCFESCLCLSPQIWKTEVVRNKSVCCIKMLLKWKVFGKKLIGLVFLVATIFVHI